MPEVKVTYLAAKQLKGIVRDGETITIHPGEEVPEAANWRPLRRMVRAGSIVELFDGVPGNTSRLSAKRLGLVRRPRVKNQLATPVAAEAATAHPGGGDGASNGGDRLSEVAAPAEKVEPAKKTPKRKKTVRKKKAAKK